MRKTWAISGIDLHLDLSGSRRRDGLEAALREAMRSSRLATGARLPSSRSLAHDLGIARNTVAAAYAQLVAEGWLEARQGSGTWVAEQAPAAPPARDAPELESRPLRYDLRPGSPDLAAFPRTDWLRASQRALRAAPAEALGYPKPPGLIELRRALAEYLARARGVDVAPERIVVCSGFAQGLSLVAAGLRAAGVSRLGLEAFGHQLHRAILVQHGLATLTLEIDSEGARVDALDGSGAVLLTPAHQFPLGVILSARRRREVVEWARASGAFVIEDDYDGEFRYDRQPIGALQALAPERVMYAGTASKALAPGLRLGWLVVPSSLLEPVIAATKLTDGPSAIDQLTMAQFLTSGAYDRQVRRARLVYRRRRDKLITSLVRHLSTKAISGAAAGLHLVVALSSGVREEDAVVAARERGLALEGLDSFRLGTQPHPAALVVGYGTPPEHAFTSAVARLGAVCQGLSTPAASRRRSERTPTGVR